MKFRFLLWMLGRLMAKASRENPAFQQQLVDRDMVFQLHTLDGKMARSLRPKASMAPPFRPTDARSTMVRCRASGCRS